MSAKSIYLLHWQANALPSEAVTWASPIGRGSAARHARDGDGMAPNGTGEGHQRGAR